MIGVDGVGGMDEDDGGATVEFCPYSDEVQVAQIVVVGAVARHENDTTGVQRVEGVGYLGQGEVGSEECWHGCEEAIVFGIRGRDGGAGFIDLAGEMGGRLWVGFDVWAWCSGGQDNLVDVERGAKLTVGCQRPSRYGPSGGVAIGLLDG